MNKLQKAVRLEKKGKYKSALKLYSGINENNISEKDYLYARRSTAACLYYLKEYDKAVTEFEMLLKEFSIDTDIKNQIEDNIQLCHLYGTSVQKGITYFKDKSRINVNIYWYHWYTGQGYQRIRNYEKAEKSYNNAYKISVELKSVNAGFFFLYLAVINLFQLKISDAEKILNQYEEMYQSNKNKGLFLILRSLVIMDKNQTKGEKLYKKGLKKENWQENIDLANELYKIIKTTPDKTYSP